MKGKKYTDPIDGKGFRSFLPYGYENPRENVLSPSTLSLERHRLLWLYLQSETNFFSAPLKVLHFAPEQPFYRRFRRLKNLDYTTTDLNSPLADVKADICHLPFENNSFDFVMAFASIYMLNFGGVLNSLREIQRVGKGRSYVTLGAYRTKEEKELYDL